MKTESITDRYRKDENVMKRTTAYLALLLIFALLLSACGKQPPEATDPTAPSQQQNVPDTTPTTQPTDPPALTLEEEFQNLIKNNEWYKRALGCVFDKPENLPAYLYFYLGVGENGQFTVEESAFLKDAYEQTHTGGYEVMSDIKLPVTKINEALSILGITIEDIRIPDKWVYYDKTDSYYFWVSDAYGVTDWSVTKVEKDTDGKVTVYWETEEISILGLGSSSKIAKMVLTMQQQPDGTYRILSNVPQT